MATRAWDDTREPQLDLIQDCVHCGFCLPTCPTYSLWGEEMDSPRGRIVLMKEGLQEGSELSAPMVQHLDNCLGCMACVTACPSGVQYDKLIEDTRAQVERRHSRPLVERLRRRAVAVVPPEIRDDVRRCVDTLIEGADGEVEPALAELWNLLDDRPELREQFARLRIIADAIDFVKTLT